MSDYKKILKGHYRSTLTHRQTEREGYLNEERVIERETRDPKTGEYRGDPRYKTIQSIDAFLDSRKEDPYPNLDVPIVDPKKIPDKDKQWKGRD